MTKNDRAWNEYIRKGHDYIEFGSLKSRTSRSTKQWSRSSSSSFLLSSQAASTTTTTATAVHRTTIETTHAYEKNIARKALQLIGPRKINFIPVYFFTITCKE